jgi:hypothetical protein
MSLQATTLTRVIHQFASAPEIETLAGQLSRYTAQSSPYPCFSELMALYETAASYLEQQMSLHNYPEPLLEQHSQLYQEMENQFSNLATDPRHDFFIIIPVADRPQQLQHCLDSLLALCQRFAYGGVLDGRFHKIKVMVADDSQSEHNRTRIHGIVTAINHQGLSSEYFGQTEQRDLLHRLAQYTPESSKRILGNRSPNGFYHKGASITRNLCYLKLNEWISDASRRLIWFLDSDQAFRVNPQACSRECSPINYFHQIDRIFRTTETQILTGKVVGDPPVSPAVMGGNLLEDVINFLSRIAQYPPHEPCQFHDQEQQQANDAAYHDMADLFGFQSLKHAYHYDCTLSGKHSNHDCLSAFAAKLSGFFDGVHPTRQTYYTYEPLIASIKPARTVYTGNYLIKAETLNYFIPFAAMGLRMAGPVLGRIIQAELGDRFVSANLPLLHKRALAKQDNAEFRIGIERQDTHIDLSDEFERQYYGDVMLFTIEALTERGFPQKQIADTTIKQIIDQTESSLHKKYLAKQEQIISKITQLENVIHNKRNWWQSAQQHKKISSSLYLFAKNMQHNFGQQAPVYQLLKTPSHREKRCNDIYKAIRNYITDRTHWCQFLAKSLEYFRA